mgnify:CR=1 FL=1
MIKRLIVGLLTVLFLQVSLNAQTKDPVLFSVNETPVHLSEFNYIYSKTNGEKADYSKASLEEYLDLYVKFKLKVHRAKDMQLDTVPALKRELAGYRQQLANSYLVDKEVTERLVQEAYDRTKEDIDISHIMIGVKAGASKAEEDKAYKAISAIYEKLQKGGDFNQLAKENSQDDYSKNNGGRLGYFTAMFRRGFYEMETAAYTTKIGKYSKPVRTAAGYHIIKVNKKRPARGELTVAHILARHKKGKDGKSMDTASSKTKIDAIYKGIKGGLTFEDQAKKLSEDKATKDKGGLIGPLTTNSPVDEAFKDAAFSLAKDGDITEPFESSVGWHIVKRISKKETEPFDIAKRRLQTKILENTKKQRSSKYTRQAIAKDAMVARIKKDGNFKETPGVLSTFTKSLDSTFVTPKWKTPTTGRDKVLFTFSNGLSFNVGDFADYARRSSLRMRASNRNNIDELVQNIYDGYVEESCLKYEESQLEAKYPEFKSLMREYEEGILLFEATKILVWDKASQDTVGLKAFHSKNPNKYMWDERAEVTVYTLKADHMDVKPQVKAMALKKDSEEILKNINKIENILAIQSKTIEKGKDDKLSKVKWEAGAMTDWTTNPRNKAQSFMKIKKILPPEAKTLKDARGYVIADYQDNLEKEWLQELRDNYKVNIDRKVFEGMIKK